MSNNTEPQNNRDAALAEISGNFKEYFEAELASIDNEIASLDSVIQDMLQDKDNVLERGRDARQRSGGSPLVFVSTMYANIIAGKNARISLMKDKVALKKLMAELNRKSTENNTEDEQFSAVARALLRQISEERGSRGQTEPVTAPVTIDDATLEALDASIENEYAERVGAEFDPQKAESDYDYYYLYDIDTGTFHQCSLDYEFLGSELNPDLFNLRVRDGVVTGGYLKATRQKILLYSSVENQIYLEEEK